MIVYTGKKQFAHEARLKCFNCRFSLIRHRPADTGEKRFACGNSDQLLKDACAEKIEDIQFFGMNMPFISSSEAKNAYFMSGEATNEIYIFSLQR